MYKLIIVDDEKIIRRGIRDYIDWAGMGFMVADIFEDGKEAMEYLSSHEVDVVLADIEMAEVSGLEMARRIKEGGMRQRVVIISGYKDFEYARKAVDYGVELYLLKPLQIEEVQKVFLKISKDLDAARKEEEQRLSMRQDFADMLPELMEQFWLGILVGALKGKDGIIKRKNLLGMEIDVEKPCALIDVRLVGAEEELAGRFEGENYMRLLRNIFGNDSDELYSFPVGLSGEVTKVVVVSKNDDGLEAFGEKASRQMEEQIETAESLLKIQFKAVLEKVFPDVMGITKYQYVLSGTGKGREEESPLSEGEFERLTQKYKMLAGVINDGDYEALDGLIENIFHEFRNIPVRQAQQLCIDMFSMLSRKMVFMGIDMWKVQNEKVSYQELMQIHDLKGLKGKTKEMLGDVVKSVREKQNVDSKKFVEESIQYMKAHYAEEISLEKVANRFFLNQTYFSRLFKQYTGSTFTDYLIELRMERAKELLCQGKYKVYEVSQMIGYRSEKYFFRIFKQYTGCSPTEYYRGVNKRGQKQEYDKENKDLEISSGL